MKGLEKTNNLVILKGDEKAVYKDQSLNEYMINPFIEAFW